MTLYALYVPQSSQMLLNLRGWLELAQSHAKQAGYDADILLGARLYPDQVPLLKQLQFATDSAKLTAARVSAKKAPVHADDEQTLEQLLARIDSVREFLGSLNEADFVDAESRVIELPFEKSLEMRCDDYVRQFAIPNLYFHLTTAYSILRHNGIPLGKRNFIGHLDARPKQ